ncbi:MAG: hypothetical protein ACR2GY_04360 [Phycisphaerales bacterium]
MRKRLKRVDIVVAAAGVMLGSFAASLLAQKPHDAGVESMPLVAVDRKAPDNLGSPEALKQRDEIVRKEDNRGESLEPGL